MYDLNLNQIAGKQSILRKKLMFFFKNNIFPQNLCEVFQRKLINFSLELKSN